MNLHGFKIVEILIFRLALRMPIVIIHKLCHHAVVCVALQARVMKFIFNSLTFKFIRFHELEQKGSCDEVLSELSEKRIQVVVFILVLTGV